MTVSVRYSLGGRAEDYWCFCFPWKLNICLLPVINDVSRQRCESV